jgi:hypothetical protein
MAGLHLAGAGACEVKHGVSGGQLLLTGVAMRDHTQTRPPMRETGTPLRAPHPSPPGPPLRMSDHGPVAPRQPS